MTSLGIDGLSLQEISSPFFRGFCLFFSGIICGKMKDHHRMTRSRILVGSVSQYFGDEGEVDVPLGKLHHHLQTPPHHKMIIYYLITHSRDPVTYFSSHLHTVSRFVIIGTSPPLPIVAKEMTVIYNLMQTLFLKRHVPRYSDPFSRCMYI